MNYTIIVMFIVLGILVFAIEHLIWRGSVSIAKKTVFEKFFSTKDSAPGYTKSSNVF